MSWRDKSKKIETGNTPSKGSPSKEASSDWRTKSKVVPPPAGANPMISEQELEDYSDPTIVTSLGKSALESVKDSATVLPQEMGLELTDDAIEQVMGKETADRYRSAVADARKRSPISTTITGLAAPNPLQKVAKAIQGGKALTKGGKLASDTLENLSTSAAMQYGTKGEVGVDSTLGDVAFGAGMGKIGSMVKGDRPVHRAITLNLGDIKNFRKKGKGKADDHVRELVTNLENTGLFEYGEKVFDPTTGKFVAFDANKSLIGKTKDNLKRNTRGAVLPPSDIELRNRVLEAKDATGAELGRFMENNSVDLVFDDIQDASKWTPPPVPPRKPKLEILPPPVPPKSKYSETEQLLGRDFADRQAYEKAKQTDHLRLLTEKGLEVDDVQRFKADSALDDVREYIPVRSGRTGVFTKMDIEEMPGILAYQNTINPKSPEAKAVKNSMDNLFGGNPNKELNIYDLNREKMRLYNELSGEYGKTNIPTPVREAKMALAESYRQQIYNNLPDEKAKKEFLRLSKQYENFASVADPMQKKIEGSFAKGQTVTPLHGDTSYKATRTIGDTVASKISKSRGQIGASMEAGGPFAQTMQTMRSKMSPMLQRPTMDQQMERDEYVTQNPNRSPQGISASLMNVKIPRTTEGVLENKDVLLAKVAKFSPEMAEMALGIANLPVEELEDKLPMLIAQFPQLFTPDKYNRANGYIIDPNMVETARKDIKNDDKLSLTQKARLTDKLNKTGKLEDY